MCTHLKILRPFTAHTHQTQTSHTHVRSISLVFMIRLISVSGKQKSITVQPSIGMDVKKYGRTTLLTTGKIYSINATVDVQYDSGVARFVNQIVIGPSTTFSAAGDSGSLIVANGGINDRKPVALLFAGSSLYTIGNPINVVLSAFGVTVDGEP